MKTTKKEISLLSISVLLIIANIIVFLNNEYVKYINKFAYILFISFSVLYLYLILKKGYKLKTLLIIGVGLLIFLKIITFYSVVEINGDNINYILEGKSIARDGIPKLLYLPDEKVETSLYNIGMPILFSLLFKITGGVFYPVLFKMIPFIFSIFIFLLLYYLFSLYLDKSYALAVSFIASLNEQIVHFSSLLLTEIPFLFFILFTMYLSTLKFKENWKSVLLWILIGATLFFSAMIRNAGLLFVVVFPFVFIDLKNKKFLKSVIIALVSFSLVILWIYGKSFFKNKYSRIESQSASASGYNESHGFIYKTFNKIINTRDRYIPNLISSLNIMGQKLIGDPDNVMHANFFAILFALVILLGIIYDILKGKYLFASFLLSQIITLIIIFPAAEYVVLSRYYFATIPFLYYYFYIGMSFLILYLRRKSIIQNNLFTEKKLLLLLFSIFFIVNLRNIPKEMLIAKQGYPPVIKNYVSLAEWVKNRIKDKVIVGSRKSQFFYLFSEKKGVHYYNQVNGKFTRLSPWSQELEDATLKMYKEIGVDYIVLDSFSSDPYVKLLPIIQHHPDLFEVYYFPKQFNIPEGYIKNMNDLFAFINNYYRKTGRIFVPTVLLKINKDRL